MAELEVRHHEALGYAVRWPGEDVWWVKLGRADATPQRMADHAVQGKGWRELGLREPADDRCRNCGRTQAHCDRRTIKFCCSACDHAGGSK